jgi:hypothetical protein
MAIVSLCKNYDAADKAFKDGNAEWLPRLLESRTMIEETVNRSLMIVENGWNFGIAEARDDLAYFSAWAIMRGGFRP